MEVLSDGLTTKKPPFDINCFQNHAYPSHKSLQNKVFKKIFFSVSVPQILLKVFSVPQHKKVWEPLFYMDRNVRALYVF